MVTTKIYNAEVVWYYDELKSDFIFANSFQLL